MLHVRLELIHNIKCYLSNISQTCFSFHQRYQKQNAYLWIDVLHHCHVHTVNGKKSSCYNAVQITIMTPNFNFTRADSKSNNLSGV